MHGVFLDQSTLRPAELDFSAVESALSSVDYYPLSSESQIAERLRGAEVVITNKAEINRAVITACPDLKLICVSATGTNNVDLVTAQEHGITVCNVSGYAGASVVQHTMSLMLALANNWHQYDRAVREGEWAKSHMFCLMDYPAIELAGKKLGIIGYGTLGQGVAKIAKAFGMEVLVCQSLSSDQTQPERLPFWELVAEVDFLSLHCPLSPLSENLINTAVFEKMKPSAFLINVARGGIVNEEDLLDALQHKVIAGAALDVLGEEPPAADQPLIAANLPNLLITPHSAWVATECRQRLIDGVAQNIEGFRQGKPQNVVTV